MRFFHELREGQTFRQLGQGNGPLWRKKSSRTAELASGKPGAGPNGRTWVHFGAQETVQEAAE